ncbi:MAG: heme exporter protein CcmB [Gemmatimonadetes bacterium]|nr:heme exporter protein CcmB [Gemmatimonadota bacterium]
MTAYLNQVRIIVWRDLTVELRSRERIAAMGGFAVLVAVLIYYAIDLTIVRPRDVAAGLIWMTILFSGMLGFGRAFAMDLEQDQLQGILLSPISRGAFYLGKTIANFALLTAVEALVFTVFGGFFNLSYGGTAWLIVAVVVATAGVAGLGTLLGAIAVHTRPSDSILPLLAFPLLIPLVIHAVMATGRLMAGRPPAEVGGNLRMLAAFAILFLAAGTVLFRYVVEE